MDGLCDTQMDFSNFEGCKEKLIADNWRNLSGGTKAIEEPNFKGGKINTEREY